MKKLDIVPGLLVRTKDVENNYQIEMDKHKLYYRYARVTSIIPQYISSKKRIVSYVYFVPTNGVKSYRDGLVSCRTLSEFKKEFKYIKFYKPEETQDAI